jgi:hypothetical protein
MGMTEEDLFEESLKKIRACIDEVGTLGSPKTHGESAIKLTEDEALEKARTRIKKRDGNFGIPVVSGDSATELTLKKLGDRKPLKKKRN